MLADSNTVEDKMRAGAFIGTAMCTSVENILCR